MNKQLSNQALNPAAKVAHDFELSSTATADYLIIGKWYSMKDQKIFTTSLYGRFGYFVMSIAFALIVLIFLYGIQDIIHGKYTYGGAILTILFGISGIYYLAHCLKCFLSPSFRFKISDKTIVYNGIFSKKVFAFKNINRFSIHYGHRSPFVFFINLFFKKKKVIQVRCIWIEP